MKGLNSMKKGYVFAAAACALGLVGGGAYTVQAAPVVTVTYDAESDSVAVASGNASSDAMVDYKFYTTTAPNGKKKTVAASNKWVAIEEGTVDLSSVSKASTLYFANSTTPSIDEVIEVSVPAKPTLSKASFVAKNESAAEKKTTESEYIAAMFEFKKKVGKTASDVTNPASELEYRLKEGFSFWEFASFEKSELLDLQRFGGTISVRTAGKSETVKQGTEDSKTSLTPYVISDTARPGVAKNVKIAKRAAGPAVSVNYANHVFTLKANQAYGYTSELGKEPTSWTTTSAKEVKAADAGKIVAVKNAAVDSKKAASFVTYVEFPEADTFAATNSKAVVLGNKDGDVTIGVINDSSDKISYQYLLVDSSKIGDILTVNASGNPVFNYDKATTGWKTITKKANQKSVSVNVGSKKLSSVGYILVRKAAEKTTFSSKVVVFKAPTADGGTWSSLAEENYNTAFTGAEVAPSLNIKQTTNTEYKYTVTASGSAIINGTSKKVSAKGSDSKTYKYTSSGANLTMDKVKTNPADSTTLAFTLPKGFAKVTIDSNDIEFPAYIVKGVVASGDAGKTGTDDTSTTDPAPIVTKVTPSVNSVKCVAVDEGSNGVGGNATIEIEFTSTPNLDASAGKVEFGSSVANCKVEIISRTNNKVTVKVSETQAYAFNSTAKGQSVSLVISEFSNGTTVMTAETYTITLTANQTGSKVTA